MKKIFKFILKYYLKFFAKLYLLLHRPFIITIAGSTNKYFVKEEIKRILSLDKKNNSFEDKSFNTEIGLPLAILSLPSGYNYFKRWIPTIINAPLAIFKKPEAKVLILEFGVSDPGDMKYLLSIVRPNIAIVTNITQRYLEGFEDMDNLMGEYDYLLRSLKTSDLAVLNFDNSKIKNLKNYTKAKIESFGFSENVNWQATEISQSESGQNFKIIHNSVSTSHHINKFGKHHIYTMLIGQIIKNHYAA